MEVEVPESFTVTSVHELIQALYKLPSDAKLVDWCGRGLMVKLAARRADNNVSVRLQYIRNDVVPL